MFNTHSAPLRIGVFCACLLLLGLLTGCGGGSSSTIPTVVTANGPVTSATRAYNNLQFTLSADKAVYTANEKPVFTFTVKNIGTQTILFSYGDAATYRINISQASSTISSYPQIVAEVVSSVQFAAGETKTFTATWDHLVEANGTTAAAGQYTVAAYLPALSLNGTVVSTSDAQSNLSANIVTIQTQ